MDFSVWECNSNGCAAKAAATANHTIAGVNLNLTIDFGAIRTGPALIFNTELGTVLRKIMEAGLFQLSLSPHLNNLSWNARVQGYDQALGLLTFDAGAQSRIRANQTFEVYSPTDASSTGVCNVFQRVANIHTTSVDTASSVAIVDAVLDSRGIQIGDVVMIRRTDLP